MNLFAKLWRDDAGVVTLEYLVLGTFLALVLIVGVVAISNAVNTEFAEVSQTLMTFNQSYNVSSTSSCGVIKFGSAAFDTCGTITFGHTTAVACSIDVNACN